tara:strand:+ start:3664 stop:3972 length:309 start_codon:yes stop_codon:yes gene_type:complete
MLPSMPDTPGMPDIPMPGSPPYIPSIIPISSADIFSKGLGISFGSIPSSVNHSDHVIASLLQTSPIFAVKHLHLLCVGRENNTTDSRILGPSVWFFGAVRKN